MEDTMKFLVTLDSAFEIEIEDQEELSLHRVILIFAQYFGANHRRFSLTQLRRLGDWLSAAVVAEGALENAVSTCFLEHMRQLKVNRVLAPHLSQLAKEKSHA